VLVVDERHQVHVVLAPDDEDALASVAIGDRMLQDVEQVATLDVEGDLLKPDAAHFPELRILRVVPGEVLHLLEDNQGCVPWRHTLASGWTVPKSVPKPGPRTIHRQPTPTNKPIKNGPEIVNFRPVL
jgi:hypothetical protein